MNRREAIVVGIFIFAISTGTVFAETNSPSTQTSALTLQTVGVDIPILKIVPGVGQGSSYQGIQIYNVPTNTPSLLNLTTAFSFAPPKGFVRVTSAALTVIGIVGTLNPQSLGVRFNGQPSGSIPLAQATSPETSAGILLPAAIHPGLNLIDIGSNPVNSGVALYEATVTIEYTFLA